MSAERKMRMRLNEVELEELYLAICERERELKRRIGYYANRPKPTYYQNDIKRLKVVCRLKKKVKRLWDPAYSLRKQIGGIMRGLNRRLRSDQAHHPSE